MATSAIDMSHNTVQHNTVQSSILKSLMTIMTTFGILNSASTAIVLGCYFKRKNIHTVISFFQTIQYTNNESFTAKVESETNANIRIYSTAWKSLCSPMIIFISPLCRTIL